MNRLCTGPARRLKIVVHIYSDRHTVRSRAIADADRHRVAGLGLVIQGRPGLQLPVAGYDVEGCRIRAAQGVGQNVAVGVGGRDRVADILPPAVFSATER